MSSPRSRFKRTYVKMKHFAPAVAEAFGSVPDAAKQIGIEPHTLYNFHTRQLIPKPVYDALAAKAPKPLAPYKSLHKTNRGRDYDLDVTAATEPTVKPSVRTRPARRPRPDVLATLETRIASLERTLQALSSALR